MDIRRAMDADRPQVLAIINDAAEAYRGVIPPDRWHDPYMPEQELIGEIVQGVVFWVAEEDGRLLGVMGIQDKGAVALVRHAYVARAAQRKGVGATLLRHLESLTAKPVLIGTWADAAWRSTSIDGMGTANYPAQTRSGCCGHTGRFQSDRSILQSSLPIADGEVRRCVTTASVPPRTSSPSLVDSTRHTASPDSHALS